MRTETANVPTLGTSQQLFGSYTIMMVDPDIPPATVGGATSELLHWMQAGFVSATTSTTIGGVQVFELINPSNMSAFAAYLQPSPPNKVPHTHRYTQLLLNTTGNSSSLSTLSTFAKTRTNFSAVNVINSAGVSIVAGNSFDVSNGTLAQSNITKTTSGVGSGASATATGTGFGAPISSGGAGESRSGSEALIAGLGALAAAVAML